MRISGIWADRGLAGGWAFELAMAVAGIAFGAAVMPILIFFGGAAVLGRYEGASLGRLYDSLFGGLHDGSAAAWMVFLGPYVLYLLFRGLLAWWRAGAQPA